MVVKYYGREYRDQQTGQVLATSSILCFTLLDTTTLNELIASHEKGACVWLVPGTFDLEDAMWSELDDRDWLLDDALLEADRRQAEAEYDPASFWEGYREDELPLDQRDWSEAA